MVPAVIRCVALCLLAATVQAAQKCSLFVSIPPQRWLVERLAGASVEVYLMITPGQNPHAFEPTARQLTALAQSQAWLTIGLPFERALLAKARGARPDLLELPVDTGVARLHADTHAHADEHGDACEVDGADPHIWLAPGPMAQIATNTCLALVQLDPGNRTRYETALTKLTAEIAALRADIAARLSAARGGAFWVYHPSWGYFADAFDLRQVAIEAQGRSPSARQLAKVLAEGRAHGVRTLFADPQFDPRPVQALARQLSADVVFLDPLAEDWAANLRQVAERIAAGATPP
ncbi:MAG: zinc ABC transporter substrate-binding protein [Kiritimatiellae bacterium]|nr:zinc ABC transporter substrate-binding protein [Kiritimatiellia bacterium]